jgi:hypothetical protein
MNFIVGRITKALYVHIDSAMRDIEQSAFWRQLYKIQERLRSSSASAQRIKKGGALRKQEKNLDGLPEIQKRITRRRHRRKLNPGKSRVAKTRGAQKDNQQRKRCNARFDALRHRP